MKKIIPVFMLLLLTALISVSCKTTPPAKESGQSSIPEALKEPIARVEVARQRAIDFESPAYFPSEWEEIEIKYRVVGTMSKLDNQEILHTAAAYNSVAESYDGLFKKTVPLYAQAREDEILAAREKLIHTGFTEYFPDYLEAADNITLAALEQYEDEEYYTARETASKALNEYETLLLGADVYLARQEIVDRDFVKYDEENFNKADSVAETAIEEYEAGIKDKAIEHAQEALLRYNLVLSNAWTAYSAELRISAGKERELALEERANIASRDLFRDAETVFNDAGDNIKKESYHQAAIQYIEAEAMFALARKDTAERRQRAEAAIRMAEEKIEESSESGMEAERIIEGGSR